MTHKLPRLSAAETAGFHLNYLAPVVTRSAIVGKPRGLQLISRLHPDPIGKRFFNRLRSRKKTTAFLPRTLALIVVHPEVHADLIREINGTDVSEAANIDGLTNVENAVHETLRLWSGTPLFKRECLADVELGDLPMHKGVQVCMPVAYLCRDPVIYGEDAEFFQPDRWKSEHATFMLHFGQGSRRCAGRDIALFVLKAAIAHLLGRHRYRLHSPVIPLGSPIAPLYNHFRLRLDRV